MKGIYKPLVTGLVIMLCSCNGNKTKITDNEDFNGLAREWIETAKQTEQTSRQKLPALTEDIIVELWKGVPDHGINPYTRNRLSREFYKLVDIGFAVPGNCPGGIGDEEFMWYWYLGQDSGNDDGIAKISIDSEKDGKAFVKVYYRTFGEVTPHFLELITEIRDTSQGEKLMWVINDFDGMKGTIYEYVRHVGYEFLDGYAEKLVDSPEYSWMGNKKSVNISKRPKNLRKSSRRHIPEGCHSSENIFL